RRASEETIVGERNMGDARLDWDALTWGWFDALLKDTDNGMLDTLPKVQYFTMGANRWQSSDTWPPAGARPLTYWLASDGNAGTSNDDGRLQDVPPTSGAPDRFTYDPMDPVPSFGGNVCCTGNAVQGGAFDQSELEQSRSDILVYTTEPLAEGVEISGPVEV